MRQTYLTCGKYFFHGCIFSKSYFRQKFIFLLFKRGWGWPVINNHVISYVLIWLALGLNSLDCPFNKRVSGWPRFANYHIERMQCIDIIFDSIIKCVLIRTIPKL